MGDTVKVKLLRTRTIGPPGTIIRAFGHDFVRQANGECHCDMHKDFIPTEVAAGRVEVIEPKIPEKKEFVPELAQFSFEVSDFYGSGSMDKLMTNLSRLRKELLQEFAETRLSVEIPDSVSNKRILNQIKTLVMTAHGMAEQSEKQEEDKEDDTDQ